MCGHVCYIHIIYCEWQCLYGHLFNIPSAYVIKTLIYYQMQKNLNAYIFCSISHVKKHGMVIPCWRCKLHVITVKRKNVISFMLLYFHTTRCETYGMESGVYSVQNREVCEVTKQKALSGGLSKYKSRITVQQEITVSSIHWL